MRNVSAFQPNGLKQIQLADTTLFSDANLVSYWKLEDLNDSKGSNHLTNNGTATFVAGKFNNGVDLESGSSQWLSVADSASLSITGSLTLSGWVNVESSPSSGQENLFISKYAGTGNQRSYYLSYYNNGGTLQLGFGVSSNGTAVTSVYANQTLNAGTWYQITAVYTVSTKLEIFVNGVSIGSNTTSIPASVYDSSASFGIGRSSDGTVYFDGIVDDVAVFSKALTAGEVQQLYYSGSTKAYYPLNGSSTDYSGNGNHGTDTAITFPQGRFGQGAKFNGSSSKIVSSSNLGIDGGNITMSMWVKANAEIGSGYWVFAEQSSATSDVRYSIDYDYNSGTRRLRFVRTKTGVAAEAVNYTTSIGDNKFYNLVLTYDGTNIVGYVNGVAKGIQSASGSGTGASNGFAIGCEVSGSNFANIIGDEVIIESRAWTAKEVETYYKKSTINYRQKSFGNRILEALLQAGTFVLTGKQMTGARAIVVSLLKGVFTLTGKILSVPRRWTNITKNSSTWTNNTKNSSTWTNRNKS